MSNPFTPIFRGTLLDRVLGRCKPPSRLCACSPQMIHLAARAAKLSMEEGDLRALYQFVCRCCRPVANPEPAPSPGAGPTPDPDPLIRPPNITDIIKRWEEENR